MLSSRRLSAAPCSGVAPSLPRRQRLAGTAARAARRSLQEHAATLAQRALVGATGSLLLGAAAAASGASAITLSAGAMQLDVTGGTVPLKRAVVEEMLRQRLTDRLHSLSDSQLAEILEQLLKDDAARFPAELLQPQPLPQQQPPAWQPSTAPLPEPVAPQQLAREQQAGGATAASANSSSGQKGSSKPISPSKGEADLTKELLQQFRRQPEARSCDIDTVSNRTGGGMLPGLLAEAGGWRLAVLAIVVPAVLIASLGKLLGSGGEQQEEQQRLGTQPPQQPQQLQRLPAQQAAAATAAATGVGSKPRQQAGKEQWSLLPWLFGRGKALVESPAHTSDPGSSVAVDAPASAPAAAPAAAAGATPESQQAVPLGGPSPSPPLPLGGPSPSPPLPLVYAAQQAVGSSAAAVAGAPLPSGTILWQRKEPAVKVGGSGRAAADGGAVLWRGTEPPEPARAASPAVQQQEPVSAPVSSAAPSPGALASSSSSSSSKDVDLWRLPLEQLRSFGMGIATAPVAMEAAASSNGSNGSGAVTSQDTAPNGAPAGSAPLATEEVAAAPAANGSSPSPVAPSLPVGRRLSGAGPEAALDNAEPAGWFGRLQRMRSRSGTGARAGSDDN